MSKKSKVVAAVAALVVAVATAILGNASPAAAATVGSCNLNAPSKVAINNRYQAVTLRLSSNCAQYGATWASWNLYHPTQGIEDVAFFDGQTTDIWDLYDWEPLGVLTWRP